MKKIVLAALCSTALAGAAQAADFPSTYNKSPVLSAAPASNWSGFYAGVNAGYGFGGAGRSSGGQTASANNNIDPAFPIGGGGNTELFSTGGPAWNTSAKLSGFVGGAQAGYNVQVNSWVFGVETDFQGADLSGSNSSTNSTALMFTPANVPADTDLWAVTGTGNVTQKVNYYGTLRGRVGVTNADNSVLVYGTGGLAYGQVQQTLTYTGTFLPSPTQGFAGSSGTATASSSQMNVGWTVGGGFEWRPAEWQNWSIKTEYLYTDLGSSTVSLTAPAFRLSDGQGNRTISASNTADFAFQTVKVGLNYHFN